MRGSKFVINGSTKALFGSISVGGAKNDALKGLAATLLVDGVVEMQNVPRIEDIFRANELLIKLGARVSKEHKRVYTVDARKLNSHRLDFDIAQAMRASIMFVGPLLLRKGRAVFPHPGGCVIGKRPIDIFLDGWRAMGVKIERNGDSYALFARRIRGCDFTFRNISHTATEALMMTAVLAHGKTTLRNAACEPEVVHLAAFLNQAGARIEGAGTHTIEIEGTGGKLL